METILRVCPFCGGKAEFIDEADDWYSKYSVDDEWVSIPMRVQCTKCGANIQAGDNDAQVADANDDKINTPEEWADLLFDLIAKDNGFKKLTGD